MPAGNFIKENLALILGIALPVVMMAFFFVAATMPQVVTDPPKHDMVFTVNDHGQRGALPVTISFVVKNGVLNVQYVKVDNPNNYYYGHQKVYLFEAKTQKVRELPFELPEDLDKVEGTRTEVFEPTKDMKLDTHTKSPDGYELSYSGYSRSGLVGDIFWGGSRYSSAPLLTNGEARIKLAAGDDRTYFYYHNVSLVGWVVP